MFYLIILFLLCVKVEMLSDILGCLVHTCVHIYIYIVKIVFMDFFYFSLRQLQEYLQFKIILILYLWFVFL